jgi:hypothetical protein
METIYLIVENLDNPGDPEDSPIECPVLSLGYWTDQDAVEAKVKELNAQYNEEHPGRYEDLLDQRFGFAPLKSAVEFTLYLAIWEHRHGVDIGCLGLTNNLPSMKWLLSLICIMNQIEKRHLKLHLLRSLRK